MVHIVPIFKGNNSRVHAKNSIRKLKNCLLCFICLCIKHIMHNTSAYVIASATSEGEHIFTYRSEILGSTWTPVDNFNLYEI